MNIKSLLLGSAAALVAVSGARAADAIVAIEPEPVEYVRVCDAFGTGYFYIPGTETCLSIGGYVRYDIFGADLWEAESATGDGTYDQDVRFSLQVNTATETELGTLRTYAELRYDWNTSEAEDRDDPSSGAADGYVNDNSYDLNHAWIQLGGLRLGKSDSFFTTWTGYAGAVVHDTMGGGYGPFDTNLISYTYSGGNWRAGIAVEQGNDSFTDTDTTSGQEGWGIQDYMPHVVAGLGVTFGMVDLAAVIGWDSRDDFGGELYGGLAGKVRADVTFNDQLSMFVMVMYGENESAYTTWANGPDTDETLAIYGGGSFVVSERATFNFQAGWADSNSAADDEWSLVGNVAYELVPGLTITPEVGFYEASGTDDGDFGAGVRVQRTF
ncbi:porin [Pseudohoeflea coraliihabitans]|uniref:Porin n=1 Tax=Pseudohoeflea coraliihabitans TaxID=2860393 RepID=A0ABS6WPE4_9HYPH|nr:porin [Pseudohoeflea sp. DP4N28-3]MBW3097828.1 porin [Pseudohoeflea sp. DP4N28-3]